MTAAQAAILTSRLEKFMNSRIGASSLTPGKRLSRKWFMRHMPRFFPQLNSLSGNPVKDNLVIVNAYTTFNNLLVVRGLKMEARDYYNHFVVRSSPRVVAKLVDESAAKADLASRLSAGLSTYGGTIGRLTPQQMQRVSTKITR